MITRPVVIPPAKRTPKPMLPRTSFNSLSDKAKCFPMKCLKKQDWTKLKQQVHHQADLASPKDQYFKRAMDPKVWVKLTNLQANKDR